MDKPQAPEIQIHISPNQLREDKTFQDNFDKVKPKIINMIMWKQTQWASEVPKDDAGFAELGRRISVTADFLQLLEDAVSPDFNKRRQEQAPKQKRLNNSPHRS